MTKISGRNRTASAPKQNKEDNSRESSNQAACYGLGSGVRHQLVPFARNIAGSLSETTQTATNRWHLSREGQLKNEATPAVQTAARGEG